MSISPTDGDRRTPPASESSLQTTDDVSFAAFVVTRGYPKYDIRPHESKSYAIIRFRLDADTFERLRYLWYKCDEPLQGDVRHFSHTRESLFREVGREMAKVRR